MLFVDFEGRADGRSIRNIIPQLQARKIVRPAVTNARVVFLELA